MPPTARALPACLAWLAFLGAAVALLLGDVLPLRIAPSAFHGLFTAAGAAFVLWLWPFVGRLDEGPAAHRLGRAALLPILALPPALVAANLSGAGVLDLLRGLFLVGALAALAAALRAGKPHDLLGSLVLAVVLPVLAFLAGEFAEVDLRWLASISPLWAAVEIGRGPDLACAGLAALAAGILFAVERKAA